MYVALYLKAFKNYFCLTISAKYMVTPNFLFEFQ